MWIIRYKTHKNRGISYLFLIPDDFGQKLQADFGKTDGRLALFVRPF